MRKNRNQYNVMTNVIIDNEHQTHAGVTHIMCKRKMKRYLRYIMKYKADNFKFNFIHVFRCDDKGDMINNEYIRFVFSKKDINKTY